MVYRLMVLKVEFVEFKKTYISLHPVFGFIVKKSQS